IQLAVTAAGASSPRARVLFPAGSYKLTKTTGQTYGVTIPSGVTLSGVAGQSVILNTGLSPTDSTKDYDALSCAASTHDIVIEDLAFLGENNPFTYVAQRQMSCIGFGLTGCTDITVRRCTFDNQYGFTVHAPGTGLRIHVVECVMRSCANGLNVNADYSRQIGNVLHDCESIEAAGSYAQVSYNQLSYSAAMAAAAGGISLGGGTSPGAYTPGTVCVGNVIADSPTCGIIVADAISDALVSGNTILRSTTNAIQLVSGGFNAIARVAITNNVIVDAGLSTGTASARVGIYCKGNANGLVSGNTVNYGVAAGHDTFYGILLGATDGLRVTDNVLHASSTGIIFVSGTYTNQILARNTITATTPISTAGATISYATENTQHPSTFANTVTFSGAVVPSGGITGPVAITGNATVSGTVNSATISTSTVPTAAQLSGLTGGTDTS